VFKRRSHSLPIITHAFNGSKEREIIMFITANIFNHIETTTVKIVSSLQEWFEEKRDQRHALAKSIIESSGETQSKPFEGLL
jgi:hypothetical protein